MAVSVTVLMPMYNAAETVVAAAESILAEPLPGLELLVIDDGSTDGGAERLRRLGDPRIRIAAQANGGLVAALNRGLELARGEFLARMDADDLSVPGRLAAQYAWLSARPAAVACGTDYELFGDARGRVRMPRSDRACRQRMALASAFCGASILIRRSAIEQHSLRFDPAFAHAEDYEFFTRLAGCGQLGNLPMVGYRYRIHAGQVSDRHAAAQRAAHLRAAAQYGRLTGRSVPPRLLTDLLWPPRRGPIAPLARPVAAAAAIVARRPGLETARFTGRKAVEAALALR